MIVCAVLCVGRAARAVGPSRYVYRVLFDTDNNRDTGCDVPVDDAIIGNQTAPGIEQIVTVAVTRDSSSATVTGIVRSACVSGSTFGLEQPVSPGTWPVGLNDGVSGADVIEGFVSRAALGNLTEVRVYFTASRAGPGSDVMLTVTGEGGGAPILFRLPFPQSVPLLSKAGVLVTMLLLGTVGW